MVAVTSKVKVTREGDAWIADVPDVPGAHAFAGNLVALESAVQKAIALVLDLPEAQEPVALDFEYEGVDDVFLSAANVGVERRRIRERQRDPAITASMAAITLAAGGYSGGGIGGVLDISRGRVSPITKEPLASLPDWLVARDSDGVVYSWYYSEEDAAADDSGDDGKNSRHVTHSQTGWEWAPYSGAWRN